MPVSSLGANGRRLSPKKSPQPDSAAKPMTALAITIIGSPRSSAWSQKSTSSPQSLCAREKKRGRKITFGRRTGLQ